LAFPKALHEGIILASIFFGALVFQLPE